MRLYFKWDISTHWRTRFIENLACQSTEPVSILIHSSAFSCSLRLFVPAASSFYWRTIGVSTPIQMSLCPWTSTWSKCSAESLPFPGPANDLTGTKAGKCLSHACSSWYWVFAYCMLSCDGHCRCPLGPKEFALPALLQETSLGWEIK